MSTNEFLGKTLIFYLDHAVYLLQCLSTTKGFHAPTSCFLCRHGRHYAGCLVIAKKEALNIYDHILHKIVIEIDQDCNEIWAHKIERTENNWGKKSDCKLLKVLLPISFFLLAFIAHDVLSRRQNARAFTEARQASKFAHLQLWSKELL